MVYNLALSPIITVINVYGYSEEGFDTVFPVDWQEKCFLSTLLLELT